MPTLRLNTDQGWTTYSQLNQVVTAMATDLTAARTAVERLVGAAWEAPAATEFQEGMTAWQQNFNQALEHLTILNKRLNTEIEEWEATAAEFGSGLSVAGVSAAVLGATAAAAGVGPAAPANQPSFFPAIDAKPFIRPVHAQEPGMFYLGTQGILAGTMLTGQRFTQEYAAKNWEDLFQDKAKLEADLAARQPRDFDSERQTLLDQKADLENERNRLKNRLFPDNPLRWGFDDGIIDAPWRSKADSLEDQIAEIDRQLEELNRQQVDEWMWFQEKQVRLEAIENRVNTGIPADGPTNDWLKSKLYGCTNYVAERRDVYPWPNLSSGQPGHPGDAHMWNEQAASAGYEVGTAPVKGSIIVWEKGAGWLVEGNPGEFANSSADPDYGHVAYVEKVGPVKDGKVQVTISHASGREVTRNQIIYLDQKELGKSISFIYDKRPQQPIQS